MRKDNIKKVVDIIIITMVAIIMMKVIMQVILIVQNIKKISKTLIEILKEKRKTIMTLIQIVRMFNFKFIINRKLGIHIFLKKNLSHNNNKIDIK